MKSKHAFLLITFLFSALEVECDYFGLACEDEFLTILCPGNQIQITGANYGRTSTNVCPSVTSDTSNINCIQPNSYSIVATRCNGLVSCTIPVDDDEFGNPCGDTFKYLSVNYICQGQAVTPTVPTIPTVPTTTIRPTTARVYGTECDASYPRIIRTCGSDPTVVTCNSGLINILYANYGRDSPQYCTGGPMLNNSCYMQEATAIVENMCTNQNTCTIPGDHQLFGDPCVYTYKYMEVQYCCQYQPKRLTAFPRTCDTTRPTVLKACGGDEMQISCQTGSINILAANYGRTNGQDCLQGPAIDVNCHALNSTTIVKNMCMGKTSCTIPGDHQAFGDPCIGTYKYLEVEYCCQGNPQALPPTPVATDPCNLPPPQDQLACESTALTAQCARGYLNILYANYGRRTASVCSTQPILTTSCYASNTTFMVSSFCNNRESCGVPILNSVSAYGDPCYGTTKYMEVVSCCQDEVVETDVYESFHRCQYQSPQTVIACGGDALPITCSTGIINILYANYGRRDATLCTQGPTTNTNCYAARSTAIVINLCNGTNTCSIPGDHQVFGDPCVGTYKYMEVQYCCQ